MVGQGPDASNTLRLGTRKETRGPLTDARDKEFASTRQATRRARDGKSDIVGASGLHGDDTTPAPC